MEMKLELGLGWDRLNVVVGRRKKAEEMGCFACIVGWCIWCMFLVYIIIETNGYLR